jgi:phenol 2-monooxygenase
MLKSDGRWRIVVFAGDVANSVQMERVCKLGDALSNPKSFIKRFTPPKTKVDSLIEILTIHSAPRAKTELFDFPQIFRPYTERDGWDYWKVYVDDESYHEGHGHAYEKYGVDASKGCVVILRPDQYVGWIGRLEEMEEMDQYFSGFMVPRS